MESSTISPASLSTEQKEFGRLHGAMQSSKLCNAHWEGNPLQHAHNSKPLFYIFTSKEALHWALFVRNIDVRGWDLRLGEATSHNGYFINVCSSSGLGIVEAIVERTLVDISALNENGMTPLHWAAVYGHLPVVQYLCEQGVDKEARDDDGNTPLHLTALLDYLGVAQSCWRRVLTRRQGLMMTGHHCVQQLRRLKSMRSSTCVSRALTMRVQLTSSLHG